MPTPIQSAWSIARFLALLGALACVYTASRLMLQGSGFFPDPDLKDIALSACLIVLLNASRGTFYAILLPITVVYALYTPAGLSFGPPSYQYLASIFATDAMESKEFLAQLPAWNYFAALLIVAGVLAFRYLSQKFALNLHKRPWLLAAMGLLMLVNQAPLKGLVAGYQAGVKVKDELVALNRVSIESHWGDSRLNETGYEDYVLIIGESARKDYHHAYGYPVENTPFMSHANGILVDGLTAGGTNTIASLKLMLTKPDKSQWEGNYNLNLIDLIKSAGIKTYWLSNQGYLGEVNTPISAIANRSDERVFLKSGDHANQNISDFALLPELAAILAQPIAAKQKRFIVLHLYGSHPITCDRLNDFGKLYDDSQVPQKYFNVNCYLSSMKKTDALIEQVYLQLEKNFQKNDRTFSLIYFSDHGLAHSLENGNYAIHNSSGKSKRHYDIPLFKISSDDKARYEYRSVKSGLNFTEAIANWVGIVNPQLDPQFDLFNNRDDPDDYGLAHRLNAMDVPDDPAVVIPSVAPKP